jgi:hypothetical protein
MNSDGFKVPSLPTGPAPKRKQPEEPNGNRASSSKRARPTVEDEPSLVTVQQAPPRPKRTYNFAPSIPIKSNVGSDTKGKAREVDVDDGMDVAGDGDETFEADAGDEEGRFFGGGTNQTQEVRLITSGISRPVLTLFLANS